MAKTQLTVKQFATIALGQTAPPWHFSDLLKVYNQKILHLRPTLSGLSSTKAVLFFCMRSATSVAAAVSQVLDTPAESGGGTGGVDYMTNVWNQLWSAATFVLKTDLEMLESILSPVGASIVYLSPAVSVPAPVGDYEELYVPAWVTVGLSGSFAGLASLNAQVLPFPPAKWSADQWKMLGSLKNAVVLVGPGGDFTSSAVDSGGTYLDPSDKPGPAIANMMILSGG